jgi:hypothetical protein
VLQERGSETTRNLLINVPFIPAARLQKTQALLESALPEARIAGFRHLVPNIDESFQSPGGTPHRSARDIFGRRGRVEGSAGFQHGAGDVEEAVCDGSQGSAVAVASTSQGGVFRSAFGVALNSDAGPVVHGVGEAVMAGLSSCDDAALARPLGNGRDAGQTAQGGVIASLQGIEGFCEQRGEDDPSYSR